MDRRHVDRLETALKKVLVIQSDRIMGDILFSMISYQENLDVSSRSINDPLDLIDTVTRLQPDVIIVDDQGLFACHSDLHGLLDLRPEIKIIILNSNSNHVQVISKTELDLNHASDFFAII